MAEKVVILCKPAKLNVLPLLHEMRQCMMTNDDKILCLVCTLLIFIHDILYRAFFFLMSVRLFICIYDINMVSVCFI